MAKRKHNLVMASFQEGNHSTITSEEYLIPTVPKVRFEPTDQELVIHLKRKISGDPLPMNLIIDEFLFYNYDPERLSKMYGFANQNEMYFFVRPNEEKQNAIGHWRSHSLHEPIKEGNEIIGYKKALRFYYFLNGVKDSIKLPIWEIVEYITTDCAIGSTTLVLCKLYEKQPTVKNVPPDLNNPGKALTGSHITCPLQESYERKKRCLSWNSSPSSLAISCLKPCLPELPFDTIIEILSWLPVQSLLTFMRVCKRWCSLIQDYKFNVKHMDRAPCILMTHEEIWQSIVSDENFKQVSNYCGLILERSLHSQVFRIRNVATHHVLYLPYAHEDTSSMDFALNDLTGECKVACFYCKTEGYGNSSAHEVGIKVMTIGKDDQWRPLKLPIQNDKWVLRQGGKHVLKRHSLKPDKVNGFAHLAEVIRDGQDMYLEIHSFDVWSECCTTTSLPREIFLDLEKVLVIHWDHYLAVADIADQALNVLVLEDPREHRWSEKKTIFPLKFLMNNPHLEDKIHPIQVVNSADRLHVEVPYISFHELHNDRLENIYQYYPNVDKFCKIIPQPGAKYNLNRPSLLRLKRMRLEKSTYYGSILQQIAEVQRYSRNSTSEEIKEARRKLKEWSSCNFDHRKHLDDIATVCQALELLYEKGVIAEIRRNTLLNYLKDIISIEKSYQATQSKANNAKLYIEKRLAKITIMESKMAKCLSTFEELKNVRATISDLEHQLQHSKDREYVLSKSLSEEAKDVQVAKNKVDAMEESLARNITTLEEVEQRKMEMELSFKQFGWLLNYLV